MSVSYRSLTCISVWSLDITGLVLVMNMHELFAAGRFIQQSIKSVLNMILMSYKFEDTKVVTRSRQSNKDRQHNDQTKRRKEQTMIYKTPHRKLKRLGITNPHQNPWVNSDAPEGSAIPTTLVAPVGCVPVKRHEHHLTWKSCWTSVSCYTSDTRRLCSC